MRDALRLVDPLPETPSRQIRELLIAIAPVDRLVSEISRIARILPAMLPRNAACERARLIDAVSRGELVSPKWEIERKRVDRLVWRQLDEVRALCRCMPRFVRDLYLAKVDELEVDLSIIEAVGDPVRIRPLAARRFGTGMNEIELEDGKVRVGVVARGLLERVPPAEETRTISAEALAARFRAAARAIGLDLEVRIDARLVAGAATGDRGIFLAARKFGPVESTRLLVHEILGHAVAAANAMAQPIRIWEIGTAGSFADQEGLAICLEEAAGVLDPHRLRVLAARVVATDRVHAGAAFGETARLLHRTYGFSPESAVLITERAHRGGGVARDSGYLYGYLRVRSVVKNDSTAIDRLRAGRIGLADLEAIDIMIESGISIAPKYRPRLEPVLSH